MKREGLFTVKEWSHRNGLSHLGILFVFVCYAVCCNTAVKAEIPNPGDGVHIVYSQKVTLSALPQSFVTERLEDCKKQKKSVAGAPGGKGMINAQNSFAEYWSSRLQPQVQYSSAQFWGTSKGFRWHVEGHDAVMYNGSYGVIGSLDAMDPNVDPSEPYTGWLRVGSKDQSLDERVPYLGFVQPNLLLFRLNPGKMKQVSDGFEEERQIDKHRYFYINYRKDGTPLKIERHSGSFIREAFEFQSYQEAPNGFKYPKSVRHIINIPLAENKVIVDSVYEYSIQQVDVKPLPPSFFDIQHPRANTTVHDLRPEFSVKGNAPNYYFPDTQSSLDEVSRAERSSLLMKQREPLFTNIIRSAVFLALILMAGGVAIVFFLKRRQKRA